MPIPILPAGYIFQTQVAKGAQEARNNAEETQYQRAYFKGLSGLSADAREAWERQYLNEISGLSEGDKDEVFRNTVFKELFKDSDNPADQEIWNNRNNMSLAQRDLYVARKAVEEDLDKRSDLKETPLSLMGLFVDPAEEAKKVESKIGKDTLREEAMEHLAGASSDMSELYRRQIDGMSSSDKENLSTNFDTMSRDYFPNYREYEGTDKLTLTDEERLDLAAQFSAWQNIGGDNFAYRMLNNKYQDIIASNQSIWEKTVNTGAQFVDSGAGMIIRAAGMLGAAVGIGLEEDENYWDNVLDNAVTRYGDRVATTQSWSTARQQYLEENGLQDNPILNTAGQQNSILSWNTPFEVLGQYGFTAASTILSFGGSAAVEGAVKGVGWVGKATTAAKGLNTTAKGIRLAKNLIRAKDIGNLLVAAGIGTVEGGMNAVSTRDKTLKDLNSDIDKKVQEEVDVQMDAYVRANPTEALSILAKSGYQIPENFELNEENLQAVADALKQDEGLRKSFAEQISDSFSQEYAEAEEAARRAMMVDFVGNSIINGFINTTFQATLNAPSIQRSLRKMGLQKSAIDDLGVVVKNENNAWKAAAKHYTKGEAVLNRLREAWGEGIEEYTQDLSGAFGEGYAKDRMSQYLDFKYGESDGSTAFEEDLTRSITAGLISLGEAAVSQESIKDGLYGILSTAVGGPNANINGRGAKARGENESTAAYIKRRSPVTWRSALGPLFNNETAEVNEKREATAKRINDFFADPEKQGLIFNLEASTNWMMQGKKAMEAGDEKSIRDAKLGEIVSTINTLNELRGSAYYDAAIASLQARANFNLDNLNDPNSTESKSVEQYILSTQNRGESVDRKEAFNQIKKSATDMLTLMDEVEKEGAAVEKLFGSEMDRDTKESLVFHRIAANNAKQRMDALDKEIIQVQNSLNEKEDKEPSGLSKRSKRIIARFGSLGKAMGELQTMKQATDELEADVESLKDEIKADIDASRAYTGDRMGRQALKENVRKKQQVLKIFEEKLKESKRAVSNAERDIARYKREAPKEKKTEIDAEGNEVTSEILSGREVLSASEIMALSPVDRAHMLDPKNRSKYSDAQQAEIEKVELAGSEQFEDFTSKIVDRGRLESDYTGMMRTMLKMSQEPMTFARYQQGVKDAKKRKMLEEKYSYLKDFEGEKSYADFAAELNDILTTAPDEEKQAAIRVLKNSNSAYYEKYKASNDKINDVLGRLTKNEAYQKLDDNAKNLLVNTLDYLVAQDVDLDDIDAVVDALSEKSRAVPTDEPNVFGFVQENPFADYVAQVNQKVSDAEKATYTSVGEVIQNYKDVMAAMKKQAEEQAANNRPVKEEPTTPQQSAPAQAPTPQQSSEPGIFGSGAYSSPEGGHPEGSDEAPQQNPATAQFEENSPAIADAANVALTTIDNTPEHVATKGAIDKAKTAVLSLSQNFFENVEDFTDALLKLANQLDITSDPENQAAAGVIRRAASTVQNQGKIKNKPSTSTAQQQQSPLTGLAARRYNYTGSVRRFTGSAPINPNAAIISTLDINWLREKHPDSVLVKFADKYKIEDYLRDPKSLTGSQRTVKFIVDEQLANDTKASMESAGEVFTRDALPVVPVVEVAEKSDHVIIVVEDGKEHYYQPIGVLPATTNTWTSGAARLAKVRDFASTTPYGQIVKDDKGNEISSEIAGNITATPPQHLSENQSVARIGAKSLTKEEQAEMAGKTKEEARNTSAYRKMRDKFLSMIRVKPNQYGGKELYYAADNLKRDAFSESPGFLITRTPVHKTKARNSNSLIIDLFRNDSISEEEAGNILEANSRIKRFAATLKSYASDPILAASIFAPDGNGGYMLPSGAQTALDELGNKLTRALSNFLYITTKMPGGAYKYKVEPSFFTDANGTQQIMKDNNGAPVFNISIENGESKIFLGTISSTGMSNYGAFEVLRNLFLNEDGSPRMRSENEDFVMWQIPYQDFIDRNTDPQANYNVIDIYDDGILEASVESFEYKVNSVQFTAPFTTEGIPAYPTETVANPDNASTSGTDASVTQTPDGTVVDPTTGVVLQEGQGETKKPKNPAVEAAHAIVENSKHVALSEDGSAYVDSRTGKRYARVTSIIAADETASERFDPDSPWVMPSTNIGTGVDELVRDFFGNNLKETYPNMTKEQVASFVESLNGLKNQLTAAGLTIIPRDVVVTGTLDAKDSNGQTHKIDVAGTLDLLAYDAQGNFYIFDMKTFRSSIDEKKKAKYARQLSLYKKFLEDTYGVTVKDLKIIPIKVDYPAPGKNVQYAEKEGVPNQLTVNGKDYTGAKPTLRSLIPISYTEPHIQFDKLTDAEKEMFKDTQDAVEGMIEGNDASVNQTGTTYGQQQGPVTITEVGPTPVDSPKVDPITGMPMAGYENPLLSGLGPVVPNTGKSFTPEQLRWGVWAGLTAEQKATLEQELPKLYDRETWESIDETIRPSDAEKEQAIKCILGI